MNRTRISIIIPAYNEERYLQRCLDAISVQTSKPYEVIVVDNNSRDGTTRVAKEYPFVRVVSEARQGIVFARNTGFNAAKGEIIARIDADTVLPADWLERTQLFFLANDQAPVALTGGCYFYNLRSGRLTGRMYDLVVHHLNRLLIGYYFPWGGNTALANHAWRNIRNDVLLQNDVHEDLDLGICLHRRGYRVVYQPQLRVGARARRILSERGELWPYLAMWPRTLRVRRIVTWPLVWPAVVAVWLGSYSIMITEKIVRIADYFTNSSHA